MLTVLMATYNGAQTLPATLEAMAALRPPGGGWRLVVADNGSSDNSAELVRSFRDRLPLVLVGEPARGKNRALNTALDQAAGNLLVFTDDDVLPREDWLLQLSRAAEENPDFAIFGGTIQAHWAREPDDWITRFVPLGHVYALSDPDLRNGPISPGLIWGPNMAVRRQIFDAGHRFNESIGPNGLSYAMGSETEFTIRMAREGHRCWHCRDAIVRHIIREHQMERAWVMARAQRAGRGMYRRQMAVQDEDVQTLLGLPRWVLRQVLQDAAQVSVATLRGNARKQFEARWSLNYYKGYLREAWQCRGATVGSVRAGAGDGVK